MTVFWLAAAASCSSYSITLTGVMVASITGEEASLLGDSGLGEEPGAMGELGASPEFPGDAMALRILSTSGVSEGRGEVTLLIFSDGGVCPSATTWSKDNTLDTSRQTYSTTHSTTNTKIQNILNFLRWIVVVKYKYVVSVKHHPERAIRFQFYGTRVRKKNKTT